MADKSLRLVIVTPERTLLDEPASSLRFPLYDGDIGILPGRLPLIGRLGTGVLHVRQAQGERKFVIDGGFVQNRQGVVTILTNRAVPLSELDAATAEREYAAATAKEASTPDERKTKTAAVLRARKLLAVARSKH